MLLVRMGWRNLWRHRRRTLITATGMAVGVALCMGMYAFSDGMMATFFSVLVEQRLGHAQVHHEAYPSARSMHDSVKGVDGMVAAIEALPVAKAAAPRAYGYALVGTERKSAGAQLLGVDPEREARVGPILERMSEGRFVSATPAQEATVGYELARDLGVGVGDSIVAVTQSADGSLGNAAYTVVGLHKTGDVMLDRSGVYLHLRDLQDLLVLPDQAHGLTLLYRDADDLPAYTEQVRQALGPSDTVEVQTWFEASPSTSQMLSASRSGRYIFLFIIFGAAAFGVLNTMMMSVFERTRELGVLVAIGLRPPRMVAMILVESAMLAGLAAAIGLVGGLALDLYLVRYGLDFSSSGEEGFSFEGAMIDPVVYGVVEWSGILQIVVAVFVVSLLASVWPALRAASLRPVDAMRAE